MFGANGFGSGRCTESVARRSSLFRSPSSSKRSGGAGGVGTDPVGASGNCTDGSATVIAATELVSGIGSTTLSSPRNTVASSGLRGAQCAPSRLARPISSSRTMSFVEAAETGAFCIDESLRQLYRTGYIHNHARMWIAAYLQHWRNVDWRDGAQLFYRHLLDGDPASNSLSWQWVGSTFSHKPYFFNRQNVERFSDGELCACCPLAKSGCPFDDSYENLAQRLFGVPLDVLEHGPRRP
ncbi:hypothetical protein HC891_16330 [Candidatus Gracilibacteria bacterium]|nr:hypothetical protein [Candidatus Gracilibacteria bacterium]